MVRTLPVSVQMPRHWDYDAFHTVKYATLRPE